MESNPIYTLEQLYLAFDKLNQLSQELCANCNYPDCMGYIWLTEEEANRLCDNDIEVIEINETINFINSFTTSAGKIDLSIKQPKCIHRCDDRKCKIYNYRPLVCHMYPIGPETVNGEHMWVLHNDCAMTEKMKKDNTLNNYLIEAKNIINNISEDLNKKIVEVYKYVDYLSTFPDGSNSYIIIQKI